MTADGLPRAPRSWAGPLRYALTVALAVLALRAFVAEPFRIPSASMQPTLVPGDLILVDKDAYGLRLPLTDAALGAGGAPARGDVVVFRWPPDPSQDFVKRVVGLPGDVVEYQAAALTVNGEPVEPPPGAREGGPAGRWEVPAGHYFVMGDNRDNSRDSRVWGSVPRSHLVGPATLVWLSWPPLPSLPRWERVGLRIR